MQLIDDAWNLMVDSLIIGEEERLHDAGEDPVLPVLPGAGGHVSLKQRLLLARPSININLADPDQVFRTRIQIHADPY